jgi:hypothetical protein
MDLVQLRATLRLHVCCPSGHFTHETIPTICERLGLPVPTGEGTKAERMKRALEALPDECLRRTAELYLKHHALSARERNALQDMLWADHSTPEITKKIRRIAKTYSATSSGSTSFLTAYGSSTTPQRFSKRSRSDHIEPNP